MLKIKKLLEVQLLVAASILYLFRATLIYLQIFTIIMQKTLVLAEKPSAGKAIAAWLAKKHGAARPVGRSHILVGPYVVSWLYGHVLENYAPHDYDPAYKTWSFAALPIIPETWKLSPKKEATDQIKAIKSLLTEVSSVVGAADPDQEGQLLPDELLRFLKCRLPVQRLWLAAMDDASIAKSWDAMKPNAAYAGYYWSALSRSHADWLAGMNLSRACTLSSQAKGGNVTLTVGRVQTPTLALVVNRELEIETFKPVNYFTPFIQLGTKPPFKASWLPEGEGDLRVDDQGRLLNAAVAQAIAAACEKAGAASVAAVTQTKGKEQPPLPFSLSSLQEYLSRTSGMGVQDALDTAQALYEKKLTTYPRTDCEYLPESQHTEAALIVSGWDTTKSLGSAQKKANISLKSKAFDDKKITAHHAIVPRPVAISQLKELTPKELTVWLAIAKRYLLQFFPSAEFLNTEILLNCGGEKFKAAGKVYVVRGWKDAFEEPGAKEDEKTETEQALPKVIKGDSLAVAAAGYDSTTTKPPKRFTEGTLVSAMKGVHRFVKDVKLKTTLRENIGIGTEATRSSVISELFRRGFMKLEKTNIKPSEVGRSLITTLPSQITAPDMTALWQQAMEDIRSTEEAGYKEFMLQQASWLNDLIKEVPTWFEGKKALVVEDKKKKTATIKESEHACIACSATLKHIKGTYGWFFACSNEKCKTTYKDVGGVPVAKAPTPSEKVTINGHSSGDTCPECKKGKLLLLTCGPHTKSPGKQFLSCSQFAAKGKAKCDHKICPK